MPIDYWVKQPADKPLYPELEWSKPENKLHAGKLLVIGGSAHGFAAPAQAFTTAEKSGAGSVRVLLPDAIQKMVGGFLPDAEFAPSNPSGSFSQSSLDAWLLNASWADAVLIPGDLGRNSETAIVLESFVEKYSGQITLSKDAVDYFTPRPMTLCAREQTTLALSFAQLQKITTQLKFEHPLTFNMDLVRLVDAMHALTKRYPIQIITKQHDTYLVAVDGRVSTTRIKNSAEVWRLQAAARSSVWWMQHPKQPFESLTTAVLDT